MREGEKQKGIATDRKRYVDIEPLRNRGFPIINPCIMCESSRKDRERFFSPITVPRMIHTPTVLLRTIFQHGTIITTTKKYRQTT